MLNARNLVLSVLCAVWLAGTGIAAAQTPADVTGSYGVLGVCSDKEIEENSGELYVRHCFLGEKYAAYAEMSLVQKGNFVCGNYSECGGINCSKVYSGQLVGKITGKTLTLFMETGHQADELAEERIYKIVPGGLADGRLPRTDKPSYVRRAKVLENPSLRNTCDPVIPKKVFLKNYVLDVSGILAAENVKFLKDGQEERTQPPVTKRFSLSKLKAAYEWEDKREAGNYVPRTVIVRNDSKVAWTVGTQHPETCREFLSSTDRPKPELLLGQEAQSGGVEIKPGKSAGFLSCKGSIWTFDDKAACPRLTCSESCRC